MKKLMEEANCKPIVNQMPLSINKNDKELKNDKNVKSTYSQNSDEFRLSELLLNSILKRNPGHTRT